MGGSWELLEDRFLVGAGNTYTLGASGGETETTLDITNMPPRMMARLTNACTGYSNWNNGASPQGTYSTHCLADETDGYNKYGRPFSNLPPYTAVNMWLRTA